MAKKKTPPTVRKGGKRARKRDASELQFLSRLGAKIKQKRVEAGMTGEDLAKAIGIATATQYHREAGRQSGQWEDFYRYAKALGCEPADLLP